MAEDTFQSRNISTFSVQPDVQPKRRTKHGRDTTLGCSNTQGDVSLETNLKKKKNMNAFRFLTDSFWFRVTVLRVHRFFFF